MGVMVVVVMCGGMVIGMVWAMARRRHKRDDK
jgi:hypothetical protein